MGALKHSAKFLAGIDLLRRTGMSQFQLRYSDDEEPTVWFTVALYEDGRWDTASAGDPESAVLRLCEEVLTGGECVHCGRPTGFDDDHDDTINEVLTHGSVCWIMWDPELKVFRLGCGGVMK